ncbi:MAG: hypothetical protein K2X11_07795 [Acetobacteraceae bacterium]|nr:hypothetical protein [Acetobacteraceae bacterium]
MMWKTEEAPFWKRRFAFFPVRCKEGVTVWLRFYWEAWTNPHSDFPEA